MMTSVILQTLQKKRTFQYPLCNNNLETLYQLAIITADDLQTIQDVYQQEIRRLLSCPCPRQQYMSFFQQCLHINYLSCLKQKLMF
ncbi:unnamed protein product [Paramecium octaurelia]|uniref:Uncharacterized protein n=1 Tax=Paramecium octaurelia TaxID=43137 RepID=A0A8S1YRP2_PAROT|nr:unnamed protein product [Paramecium octaurelia]